MTFSPAYGQHLVAGRITSPRLTSSSGGSEEIAQTSKSEGTERPTDKQLQRLVVGRRVGLGFPARGVLEGRVGDWEEIEWAKSIMRELLVLRTNG